MAHPSTSPEPAPAAVALPEPVRRRVLDLAAEALGGIEDAQVPKPLVRVRAFAPARRASRGAAPLASALERDVAFRTQVASALRVREPELATSLDGGERPPAADPVEVAVAAYLLRPTGWRQVVEDVAEALRTREEGSAARRDQDEVTRLRAELERARSALAQARTAADARAQELTDELVAVRRDLRRHRSDADRARAQARTAQEQAQAETARATTAAAASDERARQAEDQLRTATEALAAVRRAEREGRSLAGARARLLLDTVVDAAQGLRRELALPPAQLRPGDLVGEESAAPAAGETPSRARERDDPSVLDELLLLPQAHLVVDGYNVTKTGYGDLPLADQRRRLLGGLSTLAARTGAEVTCVFDGAELENRVLSAPVRGVRVRFSAPEEIADDLIRRLVRAEPAGRVVVVVSSDRELADSVRAVGARTVPSPALVRLVGRG